MRLGKGESPELNIAFSLKGRKDQTDYNPNSRTEISMSKDRLLESHLPVASSLKAVSQSGQDTLNVLYLRSTDTV